MAQFVRRLSGPACTLALLAGTLLPVHLGAAVKTIAATSEVGTIDTTSDGPGDPRPLAIGETATYRLVAVLPPSTSVSIRFDDVLPPGLVYVTGSARVSYLAETMPAMAPEFSGIQNEADPSFPFPPSRLSFDGGTGRLTLDFGSVINNDNDADDEFLVVELDVLVPDLPAILSGDLLTNDFDVLIDEGLPTEAVSTSSPVDAVVVEPAVTLGAVFTPDQVVRGGTTTLTITVSNLAASGATGPAFDLQVTAVLDDWLDVNGTISIGLNGAATTFGTTASDLSVLTPGFATGVTDQLDLRLGGLPVDGVATITVPLHVDPAADPLLLSRTISSSLSLAADSLGSDAVPDDSQRAYQTNAGADVAVVLPTLLVAKTDSPDPVAAGGPLTYSVTVQNNGTPNVTTSGVVLTDVLPSGFVATSVIPSQGTCGPELSGTLSCALGPIAPGASANLVVVGSFPSTTPPGTIANNVAYVSSLEGNDGNDGNDTPTDNDDARAEEPTTIERQVDLAVVKTVDEPSPLAGDTVSFGIALTNHGPSAASDVTVTDTIPAGLTFVQFVPGTLPCVYAAPTLTCTFGALDAGETVDIGVEATVDAGIANVTLVNTAAITGLQPDSDPGNDEGEAAVAVGSFDLAIGKSVVDATPAEGDVIRYTLSVTNLGPDAATGIEVTDDLAAVAGITYLADDSVATGTAYDPGTGVWALTGVTLLAGESLALAIDATVAPGAGALPQPIVNRATLSAVAGNQGRTPNDTAAAAFVIPPPLAVTIEQAPGQADPTSSLPIRFIAVFSAPIDPSTFTAADLTAGGTAPGPRTVDLTEVGPLDGTAFEIAVSGMTGDGTVTVSLPASRVESLAGAENDASSSSDNTVVYQALEEIPTADPLALAGLVGLLAACGALALRSR